MLVAVEQRFSSAKDDIQDVSIEVGDLGPAVDHVGPQKAWVAAARKFGVGVVVDHDAFGSPEHDHWQGRAQSYGRGDPDKSRPFGDGPKGGFAPRKLSDQVGDLSRLTRKR